MISPGLNPIPSIGISKTDYTNRGRIVRSKAAHGANQDFISISSPSSKEDRFCLDLVSHISHEVRTATSTSDILALREDIANDRYVPDPARIAANMLLLGENL